MIVTTQTPKYEGSTVEEGGCLLDMADVLGHDGEGVKIKLAQFMPGLICVTVDSTAHPSRTAFIGPDEAEHLAQLLIAHAAAAKQARDY